ncbi:MULTISPECIES: hypothetical protein [unclassified Rummeliibacillus]|uniref:hypothetical protein n=1 Tax=unclassified Rummeliibacillus TaxID=2622809 RepID=UPI000E6759E4|nr:MULTISPECIES: hypothetical protein [unclassified Rummeliibacillus]RIJ66119.1 hypothetical protein D1606_07160 [Rummeliibacillus sp. POC4]RPJ96690.1 hypothetical protein CW357_03990 [Rummeliibacillus sp. TYF005]
MKKALLLIGTILLSLLIFIGMPYYLLKSSLMHNCSEQSATCTETMHHKLSHEISIHPDFRDSNILEKLSTNKPGY